MAAMPSLVDVDWLLARLDDPTVRVLDASWHMPFANRDPVAEFQSERIPGARFFDLDAICDKGTDLPHMLPSEEAFSAAMDALDITADSMVVVYDRAGIFSAPRVWWTFLAFGHAKVAVLDGGFPAWAARALPTDTAPVPAADLEAPARAALAPPAERRFRAVLQSNLVRSVDNVLTNIEGGKELLVDARPAGRFEGTAPEPRPGIPSGHIPGAVNVPFPTLLADGRYKGTEELAAIVEGAGVDTFGR